MNNLSIILIGLSAFTLLVAGCNSIDTFKADIQSSITSLQDPSNNTSLTKEAFMQSQENGFIDTISNLSKDDMKSIRSSMILAERDTHLITCEGSSGDYDTILISKEKDLLSPYNLSNYPHATKSIVSSIMIRDQSKGNIREKPPYERSPDEDKAYMKSIGCN